MLNPFQGWVFNSSQPLVLRGASPEATQIHPIQGWCKAMSKDMSNLRNILLQSHFPVDIKLVFD